MIEISNKKFKTKKEFKTYIQTTLMEYFNNKRNILNDCEEFDFFSEMAKQRSKSCIIERIIVGPNPMKSGAYHIELEFSDKTREPFSFNKFVDNYGKDEEIIIANSKKLNLKDAMRKQIKDQIHDFKENSELICCNCKVNDLKYSKYHVDHIIKFKKLCDMFFEKYQDLDIEIENDNKYGGAKFINGSKISIKWEKFHKNNCELRILCEDCNLKLGSKNTF